MTESLDVTANQFCEDMIRDLIADEDGLELWEKSQQFLEAYIRNWAREKAIILHGDDKVQGMKLTVEKAQQQISFIKEGLRHDFKPTALDRLISRLKDTFAKHIVPHLLWRK